MNRKEEKDLIIAANNGDNQAIEQLMRTVATIIKQVLWAEFKSKYDNLFINDIILRIMLHLHNFNYKFRLKTWVAAATRNYVINNRRNGAKWAELSDNIDPVDEDTEEEESALNDLKQAITELSTEEQHIIDLYYYKSYNMTKIGLIYGINRNKVSKRIHAILEKLKLKLK